MKKLDLKALESKLPKIDENYSKILIGGDSYGEDYGNRNELNSGPTGPLYDPSDDDHDMDEGPMAYDEDTSLDGMYENDLGYNNNDNEVGSTGPGGPGSSGNSVPIPAELQDGIRLDNLNLLLNLTQGSENFNIRVSGILQSNSVIAQLFDGATVNNCTIQLNIGQLQMGSTPANSTVSGNTSASLIGVGLQTITLDSDLVTPSGSYDINYTDNTGLDHSALSALESLVVILAHEMFHAYANQGFYDAQIHGNTYAARMQWMLDHGYPQGVVDIYFTATDNGGGNITVTQNDPNDIPQNEHDYMGSSDFTWVDDALAEFHADQAEAAQVKADLEAMIDQAEMNLGGGVDPDGGQGPGPTNEQLQDIYDNLVHELEDFMREYGWLLP